MTRPGRLRASPLVLGALLAVRVAAAQGMDVPGCGSLMNAYGPYDFTNPEHVRDKLPIVEQFHFDRGVEALKGHAQSGIASLGGDLAYTLRAFPNHHRALDTMGRYQLQTKQSPPPGSRYTAECWFERAMAFAPNDGTVRMVYGIYLNRKGDREGALQRYQEAIALMPDSSEIHYNLGLLYASMERYDDALKEAHTAYAQGFPLPGLKNKLVRAGAWRDPPAEIAPESPPVAPEPEPTPEASTPEAQATAAPPVEEAAGAESATQTSPESP
jgi:hypothetical protein